LFVSPATGIFDVVLALQRPDEYNTVIFFHQGVEPMSTRLLLPAITALAASLWLAGSPAQAQPPDLGPAVKQIFQKNCFECHGGSNGTARGVKILDRNVLVDGKKVVVPKDPAKSKVFQRITSTDDGIVMPPDGRTLLTKAEIELVKNWIAAGAPDFDAAVSQGPIPSGVVPPIPPRPSGIAGVPIPQREPPAKVLQLPGEPAAAAVQGANGLSIKYVLGEILRDVRTLDGETRRKVRYFSIAHLKTAGAKDEELDLHRQALAKAINHLHFQRELIQPTPIDKLQTIYRIDLRQLGWDRAIFQGAGNVSMNPFDLVLLEYPYGMIYNNTGIYTSLVRDYIVPSQMVRPVPFVRADWFVSRATLPPLYYDLLGLPNTLKELERELGVDSKSNIASGKAFRAGMVQSGVSRFNRVVERHVGTFGYYWRSYDYASSVGPKSIVTDPVRLDPDGGEMVFALPNGLQGYFIVNGKGERLDAAPQTIVEDTTADSIHEGQTVQSGLTCMRCHETGMKTFTDDIRPSVLKLTSANFDRQRALDLYPEKETMDRFVKEDTDRFVNAMTKLLGKPQETEPAGPVAKRFESKFDLAEASAELGRTSPEGLDRTFGQAEFVRAGLSPLVRSDKGKVARDSWETHFADIARDLDLGFPLVLIDGKTRLEAEPLTRPFKFAAELNKENFKTGEDLGVFAIASKDVFVEVIRTDTDGKQTVLTAPGTKITAKQSTQISLRAGQGKVSSKAGKEEIVLLMSDEAFTGGEVLNGAGGTSRVLHRTGFEQASNGIITLLPGLDPARTIKKTFTINVK
jgi:serine/threonine-protein kinase